MKFQLALCLVAIAAGIVVADESKGPKVTDKVSNNISPTLSHTHTQPCMYASIIVYLRHFSIHMKINR